MTSKYGAVCEMLNIDDFCFVLPEHGGRKLNENKALTAKKNRSVDSGGASWLVGRGVLVSPSHMLFYLRTRTGQHVCRSTYRIVNISRLLMLQSLHFTDVGLCTLSFTVIFATDTPPQPGGLETPNTPLDLLLGFFSQFSLHNHFI